MTSAVQPSEGGTSGPGRPDYFGNVQMENYVLRGALDSLKTATLVFDERGFILHCNAHALHFFGFEKPPAPFYLQEFIVPIDRQSSQQIFKKSTDHATHYGVWEGGMLLLRRQQSSSDFGSIQVPVILTIHSSHIMDGQNKDYSFFSSTISEPSLPNMKDIVTSYQSLLRMLPIGMCIWSCIPPVKENAHFQLIGINGLALELLGVSLRRGALLHEVIDVESNNAITSFFWNVISTRKTVFHPQFTLGHGQFSLTAFPVLDNCVGMIIEPCSITQSSKDQLFTLDHSITPFCIMHRGQNRNQISYANFGFMNFTGFSNAEIQTLDSAKLFKSDASAVNDIINNVDHSDKGEFYATIIKKNNELCSCLVEYYNMPDLAKRTHRTVMIFSPSNRVVVQPPLLLFEEILDKLDHSLMVWQLVKEPESTENQFLLVSANKKARVEILREPLDSIHQHPHLSKQEFLHVQFPSTLTNGVLTAFNTALETNQKCDIGVVSLHDDNQQFIASAFAVKYKSNSFVIAVLQPKTEYVARTSEGFSTANEQSKKRFRSMERAAWSNLPYIDDYVFREVVSSSQIGIILMNYMGKLQYTNSAICSLLGVSEEDLLDSMFVSHMENDLEKQYVEGLIKQLAVGDMQQISLDIQIRTKESSATCNCKFRTLAKQVNNEALISLYIQKLET